MYPTNYPNYDFRYPVIPSFGSGMMPMTPMTPMQPTTQMQHGTPGTAVSPITPMGGRPPVAQPGTGGTTPLTGTQTQAPTDFEVQPGPPVTQDILYTQGWLKTQIGQKVNIVFLIGTNATQDRIGTLLEVGISYVILNEIETDDILLCDIYSIKFVRVYK